MPDTGKGAVAKRPAIRTAAHGILSRGIYPAASAQPRHLLQQKTAAGHFIRIRQRSPGSICQRSAVAAGRPDRLYRGAPYLVSNPDGPFPSPLLDTGRRFVI